MVSVCEMGRKKSEKKTRLVAFRIEEELLLRMRKTRVAVEYEMNDTQLFTLAVKNLIFSDNNEKVPATKARHR